MKKMKCVFKRNFFGPRDFELLPEVEPGCEWVFDNGVVATRKWDGTACMIKAGRLYARYDAKAGKTPPEGAIPCDDAPDGVTGHWPHWVEVKDQPNYKHHAVAYAKHGPLADGTYELCGPSFGANPEGFPENLFMRHGDEVAPCELPFTFESLRDDIAGMTGEGVVFYGPSGERAKLRRVDFTKSKKP